jgi:hypothetical protein
VSAGNISELVLVSLAAMVSPTTLTFCVLALVLGDHPRRTGTWFSSVRSERRRPSASQRHS